MLLVWLFYVKLIQYVHGTSNIDSELSTEKVHHIRHFEPVQDTFVTDLLNNDHDASEITAEVDELEKLLSNNAKYSDMTDLETQILSMQKEDVNKRNKRVKRSPTTEVFGFEKKDSNEHFNSEERRRGSHKKKSSNRDDEDSPKKKKEKKKQNSESAENEDNKEEPDKDEDDKKSKKKSKSKNKKKDNSASSEDSSNESTVRRNLKGNFTENTLSSLSDNVTATNYRADDNNTDASGNSSRRSDASDYLEASSNISDVTTSATLLSPRPQEITTALFIDSKNELSLPKPTNVISDVNLNSNNGSKVNAEVFRAPKKKPMTLVYDDSKVTDAPKKAFKDRESNSVSDSNSEENTRTSDLLSLLHPNDDNNKFRFKIVSEDKKKKINGFVAYENVNDRSGERPRANRLPTKYRTVHKLGAGGYEVDPYVGYLEKMIAEDNGRLYKYNWLRTTVVIEEGLSRLIYLIGMANSKKDKDLVQSLGRVQYFQNIAEQLLTDDLKPAESFTFRENSNGDNDADNARKQLRRESPIFDNWELYRRKFSQRDNKFRNLYEFLLSVKNSLSDLHSVVKAVALKNNNPNLYSKIKILFLERLGQKELLEILLHFFTVTLVESIDQNFLTETREDSDEVIVQDLMYVMAFQKALEKLNFSDRQQLNINKK